MVPGRAHGPPPCITLHRQRLMECVVTHLAAEDGAEGLRDLMQCVVPIPLDHQPTTPADTPANFLCGWGRAQCPPPDGA